MMLPRPSFVSLHTYTIYPPALSRSPTSPPLPHLSFFLSFFLLLSFQIDKSFQFLTDCRPHSVSMGNAKQFVRSVIKLGDLGRFLDEIGQSDASGGSSGGTGVSGPPPVRRGRWQ